MKTPSIATCRSGRKIVSCILIVMFIILIGCSNSTNSTHQERKKAQTPESSSEPSREDLIEAVRNSVAAKSYTESVPQTQRQQHTCSQYDVDADPHAKANPELARCPHVGAMYWVTETTYLNQSVRCQTLPGPQFGWTVNQRTTDSWLVTYSGSSWDVSKIEGTSVSKGNAVHVSKFSFSVVAHQKC